MKKTLSILLAIIMIITMFPLSIFAAGNTTVKLVSFMRGDVTDLRSSELLEVQVEGYEGNPRELTYKWTSTLGTYLYIYNSHNMYGINNTYGEYEIYNSAKKINRSKNVEDDRAGDQTLTKDGFMWAAVYGAYSKTNSLQGTVKVEVFDKNGKKLGEDSFSSFRAHNLDADLDNVVIGLFIGEEVNALDLLGRSGVVHITCTASSVSNASITSGKGNISIVKRNGDYYVKGVAAGEAKVNITIKKESCKFHYDTSGSATPLVYVFENPVTSTTTTTLTLDKNSIDNRCEYFIDGNKGEKQPDGSILFTGLTPNTEYTVEVRAEYKDNGETKYVYSYVNDTTKPVYKTVIMTYLDNVLTDMSEIHGNDVSLWIRENTEGSDFIEMTETETGVYEASVENGIYMPWHYEDGTYHQVRNYELIISNSNAELKLYHYSVNYDTNGGEFKDGESVGTEIHAGMSAVNATSNVPVRDGYMFAGWEYDGNVIASGKQVTASISAPITLKAKWEKAVNVTINVTIDHRTENGFDPNETRTDLDIDFLEMTSDSPAFVETGDKLHFREESVTDENGNEKPYVFALNDNVSTYTATDFTFSGLLESSLFGVAVSKSGYDVGVIEKIQDENGNWTINVPLTYNPDDFDIDFSIEMADDVPEELYPDAVIVKVAYWNEELNEWKIISQHETTESVVKPGVRVDIDPVTGEGSGSYPVWKHDGDGEAYGYRAVVTGFIYGDSTIIVPTEKNHTKDDNTVIITYTDGNYTAVMSDISDGKKYSTSLNGAYYNDETDAQQGTVHGVITVEKYDVIFDANGGKINSVNAYTEKDEYYVPDTDLYVPYFEGHTFGGWFKDTEFNEPAVKGDLLTEDVTFYAKWDQILTGNVRVAGTYIQNGELVDVWSVDRAESVVVVLQEITDKGVYNIDAQTVDVVWPMSDMIYGISEEYRFTGLDPLKTYRTEILVLNYGTAYQNSTTPVDNDGEYADDFNETDFVAVYSDSNKWQTFVNAYLSFEPASYFQPVEVDASLIGKNSRPENTLVQVWYKETGSHNDYQVISQHTVGSKGIEIAMGVDGMDDGDYGCSVWNSLYNGNLYDYQAYLVNIDGEDAANWPVSIVYGETSRYSPINDAATGVLKVKLVPNRYDIIYNENYADEGVNVVSYGIHVWSYETAVDYVPVRDGYIFGGWYDNAECTGEKVTVIDESVAENTELYAKWEKRSDLELTINHVVKATDEILETETKTSQIYGNVINADSLIKDFKGYSYDSASAESVTVTTGTNEITLYYTINSYSYVVNYLEDGTDKVLAPSKNGSADYKQTVTENAVGVYGYNLIGANCQSVEIDTENNVINFYYTKKNTLTMTVSYVEKGTGNKLIADKTVNNLTYGETVAAASYVESITGYSYDSASTETVTVTDGTNELILYYTINSYSYVVNYLEDGTNKVLVPSKSGSADYKQIVTENAVGVYGYNLIGASSQSIEIDTENNVINFFYVKKNNITLTVSFVEKSTGKKLIADKTVNNLVFGENVSVAEFEEVIKGYNFVEAEPAEITISMTGNVATLYYEKATYGYTIEYYYDNVLDSSKTEYASALYNSVVNSYPDKSNGYLLFSIANIPLKVSADESANVIKVYYYTDNVGGGEIGNRYDGIPDIYQKKIIYRIENGSWADGKTSYIVEYVNLKTNGNWDVNGTASITAPTGMIPADGFGAGSWNVTPPKTVKGSNTETYIYTFKADGDSGTTDIPSIPSIPEIPGVGMHVVFGKTEGIGWYKVSRDGGETYEVVFGNSTLEVEYGDELIILVEDLPLDFDTYAFYVNEQYVEADESGKIVVKVNGYMLIRAVGYTKLPVPDTDTNNSADKNEEESLSWIQKFFRAVREFFEKLFGIKK